MPAQAGNAVRQRFHGVKADATAKQDVDAQAAHAGGMHGFKFLVADVGRDDAHATQLVGMAAQHFQHVAVVGAVHADLHEHTTRHAGLAQHAQVGGFRRGRRRVGALGHERIRAAVGGNHMRVRVAGAGGNVEGGGVHVGQWRQAQRRLAGMGRRGSTHAYVSLVHDRWVIMPADQGGAKAAGNQATGNQAAGATPAFN
ncbi:hypothetical protein D3C71_1453430 [compost metagenome]